MTRARAALVVGGLLLGTACSGGGDGAATGGDGTTTTAAPVAISQEQAQRLAAALSNNLALEGSEFSAEFASQGTTVRFDGTVDWVGHAGNGTLAVGDLTPFAVTWTEDAVLQELPGLAERLPGIRWLARPANPAGEPLDILLGVLTGLAATTPDNPLALAQRDDVRLLGTDDLDGPVERFRSGDLVLWVGLDGRLRRVDAPFTFADAPAVITLTAPGPHPVVLPDRAEVADAAAHVEIYRELTQLQPLAPG